MEALSCLFEIHWEFQIVHLVLVVCSFFEAGSAKVRKQLFVGEALTRE